MQTETRGAGAMAGQVEMGGRGELVQMKVEGEIRGVKMRIA